VEDLSEKEQIDALRAWWSENGSFVIGGIVLGVVIIFGWNRWQANITNTAVAASTHFEDLMVAAERGNLDAAETAAGVVFAEYGDSAYAGMARLAMARMYMDNGRDQDAVDVLKPLAEDPTGGEPALIARLRLGRVLLYQDKPEEVITLAEGHAESAFGAEFNELLGDAYEATGQWAEAEAAYVAALNDNPSAPTIDRALIRLKINDLPASGDAEAEAALPETAAPGEMPDSPPADDGADETPADPAPPEPETE
jgi:predicted negative regulator of RcsB-dependent stress response